MSEVGSLTRISDGTLRGAVRTLTLDSQIRLLPTGVAPDQTDPTHTVWMLGSHGLPVEVGAAWTKTIKRGENAGGHLISVSIDDPTLTDTLYLTAFSNPGPIDGCYNLVWRRKRGGAPKAAAGGWSDPTPDQEPIDDTVPY